MADLSFTLESNAAAVVDGMISAFSRLEQATGKVGQGPDLTPAAKYVQNLREQVRALGQEVSKANTAQAKKLQDAPVGKPVISTNGQTYTNDLQRAEKEFFDKTSKALTDLSREAPAEAMVAREALAELYTSITAQVRAIARKQIEGFETTRIERDLQPQRQTSSGKPATGSYYGPPVSTLSAKGVAGDVLSGPISKVVQNNFDKRLASVGEADARILRSIVNGQTTGQTTGQTSTPQPVSGPSRPANYNEQQQYRQLIAGMQSEMRGAIRQIGSSSVYRSDVSGASQYYDVNTRQQTATLIDREDPAAMNKVYASQAKDFASNLEALDAAIRAGTARILNSTTAFVRTGPGERDGVFADRNTGNPYQQGDTRFTQAEKGLNTLIEADKRAEQAANRLAQAEQELANKRALEASVARGTAGRIGNSNNFYDDSTGTRRYASLTSNGARYLDPDEDPLRHSQVQGAYERAQPRGIVQGFAAGLMSTGSGGGQASLANLAQAAGTTVKYSALYQAMNSVQQAASAAWQEILNYDDSVANIQIAEGQAGPPTDAFINQLSDIASVAGGNVGDAMDVAAQGMQAFGDVASQTREELDKVGATFASTVTKLSIVTGQDLQTSSQNMRAILSGLQGGGTDVGTSATQTSVLDAIAGAHQQAGVGGDENDITEALAAISTSGTQAGFSQNELANIAGSVTSRLGESGDLAGTRLSRIFSIVGGTQGQNAIQDLNQNLGSDQQIDTTGTVAEQVRQLSSAYGSLSDSEKMALTNSLGGASNTRELFTLLENGNNILETSGNNFDYVGKNAEEVKKRLNSLTGSLQQVTGNIRNTFAAVNRSGLLDPLGVALKGIVAVTGEVRRAFDAFDRIPGILRRLIIYMGELYLAMKLIRTISAAGGVKNFVQNAAQNTESALLPQNAAARRANSTAAAETAAAAGAAGGRAASAPSEPAPHQPMYANAPRGGIVDAEVVRTRTPLSITSAAGSMREQVGNAQRQLGTNATEMTAARDAVNMSTAGSRTRAVAEERLAAAETQQTVLLEQLAVLQEQYAVALRAETAAREAAAATTRGNSVKNLLNSGPMNAIRPGQDFSGLANRYKTARTARLAQNAEAEAAAASGAAGIRQTAAAGLYGDRRVISTSATGASTVTTEAKNAAALENRAAQSTAQLRTGLRGLASDLKNAATNGTSMRAALSDLANGSVANGVRNSAKSIGGELKGMMSGGLGTMLLIGAGIQAIGAAWSAVHKQLEAQNQLDGAVASAHAGITADAARATASSLGEDAQTRRESASGIMGHITNWLTNGQAGDRANEADSLAAAQNSYAQTLDELAKKNAVSNNATVDLSSADSISTSLQAMQSSGRDAQQQLKSFNDAMANLIQNTRSGATAVTDYTRGAVAAGAGVNIQQDILDTATDASNMGKGDNARKLRNVDRTTVGNITNEAFITAQSQGVNLETRAGQAKMKTMLHQRLDGMLKKSGLDQKYIDGLVDDSVTQAAQQTRNMTTADTSAAGLATLVSNQMALVPAAAAQAGSAANLSGDARGSAVAQAEAQLSGDQQALDAAQQKANATLAGIKDPKEREAKAEEFNNALAAARQQLQVDTIAVNQAYVQHYAALGALAQSLVPSTDAVGQVQSQIDTINDSLQRTPEGDAKTQLQAQKNQLEQQKASAVVAAANAKRTAALDPRDQLGSAIADAQNAADTLAQIAASGDTTSEAYQNAAKDAKDKQLALVNANITHMTAMANASLAVGDSVGEAVVAYRAAIANVNATTIAGTPERAAALRDVEETKGLAARQAVTSQTTAQRDAGIDPRDTVGNDRSSLQDLRAQLNDLNSGDATGRAKLQRQIVEAQQKLDADNVNVANAQRSASVASYDTMGQARVAVQNARASLSTTRRNTQEYYDAQKALQDALFQQAQADVANQNSILEASVRPGDALAAAKAKAQEAHNTASLYDVGTPERRDADTAAAQADYDAHQAQIAQDIAQRNAGVFAGDGLGQARVDVANAKETLDGAAKDSQAFFEAQKAYMDSLYALAQAEVDAAANARNLTIDLTDPVQTAQADLQTARAKLEAAQQANAPTSVTDPLRAAVEQSQSAADQAAFQQQLSDTQTAEKLGRISHAAYLSYLQSQHDRLTQQVGAMKTTDNGYRQAVDQLNNIDELIQEAKQSLNQQFNLNNVQLPTAYEVRRAVGVDAQQIRSQVVDYSSTNGTVIINGADFQQVKDYINSTLGTTAVNVSSVTSSRRII